MQWLGWRYMINSTDPVMGKLTSGKMMERAFEGSKVAQALEQLALVNES